MKKCLFPLTGVLVFLFLPVACIAQVGISNKLPLTHYYHFNGNANDSIGSADGVSTDITYSAANGLTGKGAGFNGTTSSIAFPASLLNDERTQPFSVSFWEKSTQTSNINFIGKLDSNTNFRGKVLYGNQQASGDLHFELISDNFTGNSLKVNSQPIGWNDGNWHMITITYDGSSSASGVEIYMDGASVGDLIVVSDNLSDTVVNTTSTYLGWFGPGAGGPTYFNGAMDNLAIFNGVLSSAEVAGLYNPVGAGSGCSP